MIIEDSKMTEKRERRIKRLYEEHGWKISLPPAQIPSEDKAPFGGGLRCFGKVPMRDDYGNKIEGVPKRRCGNVSVKGSLFCRKCGGNNGNALVHGRNTATLSIYRSSFKDKTGDLFQAFLEDPTLCDLRPELAALRTLSVEYINKLTGNKEEKSLKTALKAIKKNVDNEQMSNLEKFIEIRNICFDNLCLTDGDCIDRLIKLCDVIGKMVERIEKIQHKDDFILTPDGIKVLFRCIIDILKKNIGEDVLKQVKEEMLTINIKTRGDLSKYNEIPLKQIG